MDAPIASPCRNLCALDAARICTGCGRTIDEIVHWRSMGDEARAAVMARVRDFPFSSPSLPTSGPPGRPVPPST
ncbi:DUF1289 domain-containing protein [Sphingobium sp. GW456-12-10-14-TSB1]|uniref:DUF1289 domain-containing protein n=2 Tax=Sphingomonadaceae TaxID=41297 RepID=A0A249MTR5_SPHXE|nr:MULTISPECIES: DUF1289 domain-containing protein [Sphingobium]ASY44708.1 DUF1289 domain-containing protein [Sphingobium xenophagum]OUC53889.1 DUF1289 domain-containing protein [Sphingobium sp. GW456-12-10-14-TSB1]QWT15763.1 DUF1289 domain-containing protein [Sphingobium xenophagum]